MFVRHFPVPHFPDPTIVSEIVHHFPIRNFQIVYFQPDRQKQIGLTSSLHESGTAEIRCLEQSTFRKITVRGGIFTVAKILRRPQSPSNKRQKQRPLWPKNCVLEVKADQQNIGRYSANQALRKFWRMICSLANFFFVCIKAPQSGTQVSHLLWRIYPRRNICYSSVDMLSRFEVTGF